MLNKAEEYFGVPTPSSVMQLNVTFTKSELIDDLARIYEGELSRMAGAKLNVPSQNDLSRYFCTLMKLRVERVTMSAKAPTPASRMLSRVVRIPNFFATVLVQVGIAMDREYGIEFVPNVRFEAIHVMSDSEMEELSRNLSIFETLGLKLVIGIPGDPKGELGFMACRYITDSSDEVCSYRRDHPVMGFYAAFFRATWADTFMDGAMRIRYNYTVSYQHALRLLVEA